LLLQNGNRNEARQSFLRAAEEAREPNRVTNEMVFVIEALAENGFIRDALNVIRSLPPSYEQKYLHKYTAIFLRDTDIGEVVQIG